MSKDIQITSHDITRLLGKFSQFRRKLNPYMTAMAEEAGEYIIKQRGLRAYPPETEANQAGRFSLTNHKAMGFYIRGRGWSYPLMSNGSVRGYKNTGSSEKYGTQFYIKRESMGARIGNKAKYAKYLTDEVYQSERMAKIGWRKLIDVAREKMPQVKQIFDKWVKKALAEVKL